MFYSAHFWFPLYDPRHYTLFFLSSCPSLNSFTSHTYTRICPAGSSHSLRPSPNCSLSSRWSHHRVEMLSNLKRGRGLSRLSRFSLCCVSSRFKDSDLNVGRRYLIFFPNYRMNTWTLLLYRHWVCASFSGFLSCRFKSTAQESNSHWKQCLAPRQWRHCDAA